MVIYETSRAIVIINAVIICHKFIYAIIHCIDNILTPAMIAINYVTGNYWSHYYLLLFLQVVTYFRDISERYMCERMCEILLYSHLSLIFQCTEFVASISRRQICYVFLSANSKVRWQRNARGGEMLYIKKYFVDGGCLTGKQSGAISFRLKLQLLRIYLPSRAHPVQRKRRPRLRRVGNCYPYRRRALSHNYTAFNLSTLFSSLSISSCTVPWRRIRA